jgi:hypothetical protein
MSFPSPLGRASFLGTALFLAASIVSAQSTPQQAAAASYSFSSATESSSLQSLAAIDPNAAALPSAPAPTASLAAGGGHGAAAGQDYGSGTGWKHYVGSRFALEAGGGFNAPESSSVTWGGNFNLGGGLNFNKYVGALIEYQFIQDKLPGSLIAQAQATGGYARIWSFGIDPVINLMPKARNGVYVTGGYGFYRKVTSFTDPQEVCFIDFVEECGVQNEVVGHFSSNQGGFNFGAGFEHRLGGMYGDSKAKLFAEVRYLDVLTPAVSGENPTGSGTITTIPADTKLIPVNVGVRF